MTNDEHGTFSREPYDLRKLDEAIAALTANPGDATARAYLASELRRWLDDAVVSWEGWAMPSENAGKRMLLALGLFTDMPTGPDPYTLQASPAPSAATPAHRLYIIEELAAGLLREDGTRGPPLITRERHVELLSIPENNE